MNNTIHDNGTMQKFGSGATRDTAQDKLDFEGFLSPAAIERFARYMHEHRKQSDGSLRDSDNWQKGIPIPVYRKSLMRHVWTAFMLWRGNKVAPEKKGGEMHIPDLEEALCGILFNAQGMLHELIKSRQAREHEEFIRNVTRQPCAFRGEAVD